VTAVPRGPDGAPSGLAVGFEVSFNGSAPPAQDATCTSLYLESNDTIGVRVGWVPPASGPPPSGYRIYRSGVPASDFVLVGEAPTCSGTGCTYLDTPVTQSAYSYYVVSVLGSGLESAGPAPAAALDDHGSSGVRIVRVTPGQNWYGTLNARARRVELAWSRVVESDLVGYHVYRRCKWDYGGVSGFYNSLRELACNHTWMRLTDEPVPNQWFTDEDPGQLRQLYDYAVRPVWGDGSEGPVQYIATAVLMVSTSDPYSGTLNPLAAGGEVEYQDGSVAQCQSLEDHSIEFKTPGWTVAQEQARINGIARGTGSPAGPPAVPVLVDGNVGVKRCDGGQWVHDCAECPAGQSCSSNFPWGSIDQNNARNDHAHQDCDPAGLFAFIDWERNLESDLAGYHVEIAGSTAGPWRRATAKPLAWWETHFDARIWSQMPAAFWWGSSDPYFNQEWMGPDCAVLRVIAVDEEGNESAPSAAIEVVPVPDAFGGPYDSTGWVAEGSCSLATPTLGAPEGLKLSSGAPYWDGITVSWNSVAGAQKYRVYRLMLGSHTNEQHHFYLAKEVEDSACTAIPGTDPVVKSCVHYQYSGTGSNCPFICIPDPLGNDCELSLLEAFYVTAVEPLPAGAPAYSLGRESPPSEVKLWGPWDAYAWSSPPAAPAETLAWSGARAVPEEGAQAAWCSSTATDADAASSAPTSTGPRSVREPLLAPLARLGQAAPPPYGIYDLHVDHLGSTRLVTDNLGAAVSQHDFFPFGEEIAPVFDHNRKLFTGHERDQETGLDYMLARYYSNSLGRFLSFDTSRLGVDRRNPQKWNAYTYVLNNPLKYFDPNGLYEQNFHQGWTYFLARQAGFTESESRTIAQANNNIDSGSTSPITLDKGIHRKWHGFEADRGELETRALKSKSLGGLGMMLHPYQDSFSHAGFKAGVGHGWTTKPDKTSTDPTKAVQAALGTFGILSQKAGEMGKQGYGAPDQGLLGAMAEADADVKDYDPESKKLTVEVEDPEKAKELAEKAEAMGIKVTIKNK
jgi:RHS repeat-associated protein